MEVEKVYIYILFLFKKTDQLYSARYTSGYVYAIYISSFEPKLPRLSSLFRTHIAFERPNGKNMLSGLDLHPHTSSHQVPTYRPSCDNKPSKPIKGTTPKNDPKAAKKNSEPSLLHFFSCNASLRLRQSLLVLQPFQHLGDVSSNLGGELKLWEIPGTGCSS